MMRATYAGLLTIAIIASWHVQAAEPTAGQTMLQRGNALARALHAEESTRTWIVNTIAFRTGAKQLPQAKYDCVRKADVSFMNDAYAEALAKTLTSQELDQALAFYNSPASKIDTTKLPSLTDPKAFDSLSKEDTDNLMTIAKFSMTSAYKKLESRAYATPELKQQIAEKSQPIVFTCMAGPAK